MYALKTESIDLVILDLGLPDGHGVNLLHHLYKDDATNSALPDVVVISSYFEKDTVLNVINSGARLFINKPVTFKKLISVIYQITFLRYCRKQFKIEFLNKNIKQKSS